MVGGILLLGLILVTQCHKEDSPTSRQENIKSPKAALATSPGESGHESRAPDTEIVIQWSDLNYLGLDTEWEPDGTWFALWEGVDVPPSIHSLLYIGVIRQGETRDSLMERISREIDPDFKRRQNLFASWGIIMGRDTGLGNLLDSDAAVRAVCKGIAQKAGQNPATRPRDYEGREQSFEIGLIQATILGVDMLNFPVPPWDRTDLSFKIEFK